MEFRIVQKPETNHRLYLIDDVEQLLKITELSAEEVTYVKSAFGKEQSTVTINQYSHIVVVTCMKDKKNVTQNNEACRKVGAEIQSLCVQQKLDEIVITNFSSNGAAAMLVAEGLALANYQFLKYRTDTKKILSPLKKTGFTKDSATVKELKHLKITIDAIYKVRTLVNEPLNFLSAEQLSKEITAMGKDAGFKVTVLNKAKLQEEKMGGLLAVNLGSQQPPTFSIAEYAPKNAINKAPIVLIGKGVVYDTGGLSLKPTLDSMDRMKSDMSGAALVSGVMYAIAALELPLHIIALMPATDNRPGENAYVPGDVITMYSGATVEVLNTDAEGRMLLADALHWAKRYKPALVMDFATLTGAAAAAIGDFGMVCMGTAGDDVKQAFRESGERQYERMVEFPLWDEYGDLIKSDIADLKNVGGPKGGAITAGKFLQHFTDYPWMHFDIAGVSFNTSKKGYYTSGGTAFGVRMVLDFLMNYAKG